MGTTLAPDEFFAQTRAEWRAWLEENHASSSGAWLVFNKKTSGLPHVSYDESVEEALCFGWVDSKPGKVDDTRSKLYFAPRKGKSGWSKPNKERVERLIEAKLMRPAGLEKIEAAKRDGSWTMLDAVEKLEIPADLEKMLAQFPNAAENFAAFPRSAKRGILEWIVQAKRLETRAKRVEETARLAAQNVRANQWRQ
ncbi:MAG: hypothetical protein HC933_02705 [Pleurocapsa sp. SU_196_0]|nr:hypothetical protein [Pleurocapsa sp. SU_196_0]